MNRRPRAPESKVSTGRRENDLNRERFAFVLTSLVGRKIQAKLRNNITYEGLFHGYSLDGDYGMTLKCARELPSENRKSGEVIQTLIIPGKDFLQVTACEVPSHGAEPELAVENMAFAVDSDISGAWKPGAERELVAWQGADGEEGSADMGAGPGSRAQGTLEGMGGSGEFDQFAINQERFGVVTSFREDLYTTVLDTSTIPREKREQAERIAREIEGGRMYTEVEGLEGDGNEEQRFSAARNPGQGQNWESGGYEDAVVPLTRENLGQHETALQFQPSDGFAREHRAKRGMITAHSPIRSPMISEMKGINALNLEPALPKLDDKTRNDWINFKQSQSRNAGKPGQGSGLKKEFEESLALFHKRQSEKEAKEAGGDPSAMDHHGSSASAARGSGSGRAFQQGDSQNMGGGRPRPGQLSSLDAAGDGKKGFSFNAAAKEFSFNPTAPVFTPGGGGGFGGGNAGSGGAGGGGSNAFRPSGGDGSGLAGQGGSKPSGLQFSPFAEADARGINMPLQDLLKGFTQNAQKEKPEGSQPQWPNFGTEGMGGVSYKEALGVPNPNMPIPNMPMPQPGPWQAPPGGGPGQAMPAGPVAGGGNPQMMGQGMMMGPAGPGGGPQMYQQVIMPGGGMMQPPGGKGGGPQQPQQPMQNFQQGPGNEGGNVQNPGMPMGAAAPKFPAQVQGVPVMIGPAGQYPPQGFIPGQGAPGGGPQGPQGPGGPMQPQMYQMQQ